MRNSENLSHFSRPVRTANELVEHLKYSSADLSQHTTFPLVDNRNSTAPNLFTFAAMSYQVNALLIQGFYGERKLTYQRDRGTSLQFGFTYETDIQTAEGYGDILARRTRYNIPTQRNWRDQFFRPSETLELGGMDHTRTPFTIAMTRYKKGEEEVDVYKFTIGRQDAAKSIIMVGSPALDL